LLIDYWPVFYFPIMLIIQEYCPAIPHSRFVCKNRKPDLNILVPNQKNLPAPDPEIPAKLNFVLKFGLKTIYFLSLLFNRQGFILLQPRFEKAK